MIEISIPARLLAAVSKFAAVSDARLYLDGVLLTHTVDGGAVLVATTGAVLGVVSLSAQYQGPDVIVPIDAVLASIKAAGRLSADPQITLAGVVDVPDVQPAKITLAVNSQTITAPAVAGLYPDWRRVLLDPGYSPTPARYDVALLDRIRDAALALGYSRDRAGGAVDVQPRGGSPAMWRIDGYDNICGVISPMRIQSTPPAWPAWLHYTTN